MLRIEKNASNELIVTVTELTTITNPEYVFEFEYEQTREKVACILTDTSASATRYNSFTFVDGVNAELPDVGDYIYRVYQQASGTGATANLLEANLVEKGRAYAYDSGEVKNEYTNTNEQDEVYEP